MPRVATKYLLIVSWVIVTKQDHEHTHLTGTWTIF